MRPLSVFFLWHLHQPWYVEWDGSPSPLPWTRLHALKDYGDLPRLWAEEPRVPHVVNVVPSLLDQLALLASGASDSFLEVARRPVSEWSETDAAFAVENFFSAHVGHGIEPLHRYAELLHKKTNALSRGVAAWGTEFEAGDLLDLVVLFHLAWTGETLRKDPLVRKLLRKGRRFTEDEKKSLLERQQAYLGDVLGILKKAFESGVIEATTSPYHHPILPLLVDSTSAREARPELPLPPIAFSRPEDAKAQLELGLSTFEKHFGFRPRGMWPPEGSLSPTALSLMAEAGILWTASDEDVLMRSLGHATASFGPGDKARAIFRPYRLEGRPSPAVFFRDRVLSDRIGFSYATWDAAAAAGDFLARLRSIREAAPEADLVVPVILDGENAWESYPENGATFLRTLAATLAGAPDVRVTTPSRLLAERAPAPLSRLVTGSWIRADLTTWIGSPAKNRAWELLSEARAALAADVAAAKTVSPAEAMAKDVSGPEKAKAALFAAEASDWFWWYGDEHSSAHDAVFDALFRAHLSAAYAAAGKPVPESLSRPVEAPKGAAAPESLPPIFPKIDGARPDYFEWLGAGRLVAGEGAMNRAAPLVKEVHVGAAAPGPDLFLRLDPVVPPASQSLAGHTLRIVAAAGSAEPNDEDALATTLLLHPGVSDVDGSRLAVDRIVEARLPYPGGDLAAPAALRLEIVDAEGRTLERFPASGWYRFRTVTTDWSA